MSTTITYNDSTIAQVNNETKTLLTSGKWLTGNIVLTDVSDGSGGGSTPSATAHSIVFDLETGADVTIPFYTDSTFILDAIRATTPTTYNDVTVESASLDNVAWYTKPTGTWVTLYSNNAVGFAPNGGDEVGSYCWISEMGETPFILGDTYRITFDGSSVEVIAYNDAQYGVCIGHLDFSDSPIFLVCQWGAWVGTIEEKKETDTSHSLKVEHLVLS